MGILAANLIPAVVLLLSLLAATPPPVSAKLETFTITYDGFNSNTQKLYFASSDSTIAEGALLVTLDTEITKSQAGRVFLPQVFQAMGRPNPHLL
ncbi:hypothetical protein RHGRI_030321 [Rhododendron griersonianum]|uniref:Uncharacterized protein n=1 Tax=Rhododendron griersonianum TaxID=479676 RepID=A0AAV6IMF7_9ERIC|nr:hypothetical protein RHGRI_030321 [Rhododendron griersonianum]